MKLDKNEQSKLSEEKEKIEIERMRIQNKRLKPKSTAVRIGESALKHISKM